MLTVSQELKSLYKQDDIHKTLSIYFPALDLTINNQNIVSESFELTESICSDSDLVFGSCEASQIKFTVADIEHDLTGLWFTVNQTVNDIYPVPLGTYKVYSCKKQGNLRFKDIIAYDALKDTDIDVSQWYNGLTFPLTLEQFRASLLKYLGIEEIAPNFMLTNDHTIIEKTIEPGQLSGRAVLQACEEINGVFGHIGRDGKFKHIVLEPGYGLYPSNDLYPADDLYPIDENDTSFTMGEIIDEEIEGYMTREVRFEEYTVKEIDKLIIRSEEDDIGAIIGDGTNAYIIQGNFLVFGKSAAELETITRNAYGYMAKRPYRPYESESIGLPYVEVGDVLKFDTSDPVTGYVFQRTLTGIQALRDEYTAEGNEKREQNFGLNTEIMQIKGRQTKMQKDVNGLRFEVEDLESRTNTKFTQTDEKISLEAQRATKAEGTLSGQVEVLAGQVVLKADANGNIAAVELDADASEGSAIKIKADGIGLEGLITANGNFKILMDGSMEAKNGKFSGTLESAGGEFTGTLRGADGTFTGTLSGNTIVSPNISGGSITSTGSKGTVYISDGSLTTDFMQAVTITVTQQLNIAGGIQIYDGNITGALWDGAYPITNDTIGSQSVSYADNAHYASSAGTVSGLYTNDIYASNTGYGNINFKGFDNGAGVGWVQANFAPITSSDVRLKHDISSLDSIPDELFMSLKPKQFRYKTEKSGKGIHFGLIAQQLENAFKSYGLNPYDYNIVELKDVRRYNDDGMYVNGETHLINYVNLIPWMVKIIQEQNDTINDQGERIFLLEEKLYNS